MPAPWDNGQIRAELDADNGIGLLAKRHGDISGYAFFRTCCPECELLHLVVTPAWRRQGIAETLLRWALTSFAESGFASCLLEVRASNGAAQHLYAKTGFLPVGRRKGYYRHPVEDAVLMNRNLTTWK